MTLRDGDIVYMPCVNPVHNETTGIDQFGNAHKSTEYSIPTCVATYIGSGRCNIITREGFIPVIKCEVHQRVSDDEIDFINIGSVRSLRDDELWMR